MKWRNWETWYIFSELQDPKDILYKNVLDLKDWAKGKNIDTSGLDDLFRFDRDYGTIRRIISTVEDMIKYSGKSHSPIKSQNEIENILNSSREMVENLYGRKIDKVDILFEKNTSPKLDEIIDRTRKVIGAEGKSDIERTHGISPELICDPLNRRIVISTDYVWNEASLLNAATEQFSFVENYQLRGEWGPISLDQKLPDNYFVFEREDYIRPLTDLTQFAISSKIRDNIAKTNKDILPYAFHDKIMHTMNVENPTKDKSRKYWGITPTAGGIFRDSYFGSINLEKTVPLNEIALFDSINLVQPFYVELGMNVDHPTYKDRYNLMKARLKENHVDLNEDVVLGMGADIPIVRYAFVQFNYHLDRLSQMGDKRKQ